MPEIDAVCRRAAQRLRDAGAQVEEIAFDASDGRDPIRPGAAPGWSGSNSEHLERLEEFGANLRGQRRSRPQGHRRSTSRRRNRRAHRGVSSLSRAVRSLRRAADAGRAGEALPVEMNFPTEINGRKLENYIDWIAPAFLVTLVSLPAGSVPAGKTRTDCRSGCRSSRRASRSREILGSPSWCSRPILSVGPPRSNREPGRTRIKLFVEPAARLPHQQSRHLRMSAIWLETSPPRRRVEAPPGS